MRLHDKADGVAMGAAAEAVIAILVHVEAGGFFAVERAAPFHLAAGPGELDAPADQGGQRRASAQFLEEGFRVFQPSRAFTSGLTLLISRAVPCLALRAAITLPISLAVVAPVCAIAASTAA